MNVGITPDSRFEVASATDLPRDMTIDRLNQRRTLTEQFDLLDQIVRRQISWSQPGPEGGAFRG